MYKRNEKFMKEKSQQDREKNYSEIMLILLDFYARENC